MLSLPYIFVSEEAYTSDGKISAKNIFDEMPVKVIPSVLEKNIHFIIGITAEESDDEQEFKIRIRGKGFKVDSQPLKIKFTEYDKINVYNLVMDKFPILHEGTVYFEAVYKDKVIDKYPVKVFKKED
ncbi:hypothetical protein [Paenibacillus popilliae]|uniref:Uncharacterized protein n=1 Tax=Paenibacillus popilliae ATCC 14706 TaxID=1212764 RepID=M9M5D0_PAEPP|nr:hypothetical protein [Paenibacillus popilliae]GAC44334.1 hypothetical protein PPOP_3738 [Paenibacillus popilliae ATCC 14706]